MPDLNFKQGTKSNLPSSLSEGNVYYTLDEDTFYIDRKYNGNIERKQINANDAKSLSNAPLTNERLGYAHEVPTSNLTRTELNKKISAEVDEAKETLKLWTVKVYEINLGGSISIRCEENMTWGEWFNSNYYDDSLVWNYSNTAIIHSGTLTGSIAATSDDIINTTENYYAGTFEVCCFVAGTQILMADGTTKNIENIQPGDAVISYDIETGNDYQTIVKKLVLNPYSKHMAKIKLSNGNILEMTDYHPLYTHKGWASLTDSKYNQLLMGDLVKTKDNWSEIIDIVQYQLKTPITTYTLDVRDNTEDNEMNDNFYANEAVVHNISCPS